MARARTNPLADCPYTATNAALGGKWKLIIVYWLGESPRHFAALRERMFGISQKVLTQQLRELVADGIVERMETGKVPAKVVYSLTEHGKTVMPLLHSVRHWGMAHLERDGGPRPSSC
ncbi:HTH-type transcriptional activator HxlR [Usitatibacter rugosus]|uniref:HTH-type transcriptional activator HxlR n=1 Tax=Usitatibacter rugosus TaxID=2732067 RepID=A0A6M4GXU3_9PROT|nr:helix-turn-helix domain-containing protein [Usitatibacter rugosus]QJR12076.1 HTH-type transcriptional activator HxlR [Usitatibacter rugosus]